MKQATRLNNTFLLFCVFVSALILAGCQSLSEKGPVAESNIHTLVHKETITLFPVDYRISRHAIFLINRNNIDSPLPLLSEIMRSKGFKVTTDQEKAEYIMRITSYVTMPTNKNDQALPYSAEFLLSMREKLPVIKPLLVQSGDSPGEQMKATAKLVHNSNQGILGSDASNIISLGSTFGGGAGGLIAGAAASVIDTTASIFSRNSIREGLAGFEFSMTKNSGFLNQVSGLNVYAASATPEKPEALLDAAIGRAAAEMERD